MLSSYSRLSDSIMFCGSANSSSSLKLWCLQYVYMCTLCGFEQCLAARHAFVMTGESAGFGQWGFVFEASCQEFSYCCWNVLGLLHENIGDIQSLYPCGPVWESPYQISWLASKILVWTKVVDILLKHSSFPRHLGFFWKEDHCSVVGLLVLTDRASLAC